MKDSNQKTLAGPLARAREDTPRFRTRLTSGPPIVAAISTDGSPPRAEGSPDKFARDPGDVCDRTTLDELRLEGESLLLELVAIFQGELTKGLDELNRALVARDCATAARIAHTLKGTAGTFGAVGMQEMAAKIDQAARASRVDEATAMYSEFRSECERVRCYLAAQVQA